MRPAENSTAATDSSAARPWSGGAAWGAFALVVACFLVLKSYSLHWQTGDENIYFYMAWATIDHGALPYADYFFAHPPLHLLPGILVFALFGFGPLTVRIVPVGATLVGAVFLFLLARRHLGRVAAVAAVGLYLTAFSLLRASTHWTGINLSVMWVILGLWAFYNRRSALSGVFLALGVCTGTYVLPGAMMLGLLAALRSRVDGRRYLVGFAVPWLVVQVAGLAVGGTGYLDGVYRYHLAKPPSEGIAWRMSVQVFTENFELFLGTWTGVLLATLRPWLAPETEADEARPASKRRKRRKRPSRNVKTSSRLRQWLITDGPTGIARVGGLWMAGYLVFIAMLARVFPFYFLLLFPPMALAAGHGVERLMHYGLRLPQLLRDRHRFGYRSLAVVVGILIAVIAAYFVRVPVQRALLPNYVRKVDRPMQWSDAPLPDFVNAALRRCCFEDVARAYVDYGTVQEVLFHESRYFEQAHALAEQVRVRTRPDQTLFGDSATAGLVALLAGRRLSADFADTNAMRFRSGIPPAGDAIRSVDTPRLALVLVSARLRRDRTGREVVRYGGFAGDEVFQRWLSQHFEPVFKVQDRSKGWFYLLGRNEG